MKNYRYFFLPATLVLFIHTLNPALAGQEDELFQQSKGAWHENRVEQAIRRGVKFILSRQNPDGSFIQKPYGHVANHDVIKENSSKYKDAKRRRLIAPFLGTKAEVPGNVGGTALAVYALLKCGVNVTTEPIQKAIEYLKAHDTYNVYAIGIRCNLWGTLEDLTGREGKYLKYLEHDAKRLINSISLTHGGWNYSMWDDDKRTDSPHNSPSQYGILGIWAYKAHNGEVPDNFWKLAMKYWIKSQLSNGGWGYRAGFYEPNTPVTGSMTAAGLASMFVCNDAIKTGDYIMCQGGSLHKSIIDGLKWFDSEFTNTMTRKTRPANNEKHIPYYLYGVERVGHACGYRYFGNQDWYKLGSLVLIQRQSGNGSLPGGIDPVPETAFAMIFLAKGGNTVLYNKLNFEGDWNNRPADITNLTDWLSINYEQHFNWQVVNFRVSPWEWHDAPILVISGKNTPKFSDEDIKKLRTFVYQGGTIFSMTECGGEGFKTGIREAYKRIFPQDILGMVQVPTDKPLLSQCTKSIYEIHEKLEGQPPLFIITNSVRPLAIHTDQDLAKSWQGRRHTTRINDFRFGLNLSKYVVGRYGDLPARGKTTWPFPVDTSGMDTIKIARIRHKGHWNPEPLVMQAFDRQLSANEKIHVENSTVNIYELGSCGAKIAMLTGTGTVAFGKTENAQMKKFVEGGGTLLIDAAGGNKDFYNSMFKNLAAAFGQAPNPLPATCSIYTVRTLSNTGESGSIYRDLARKRVRSNAPQLQCIMQGDRPGVIFSREDILTGFLNAPSGTVDGYTPLTAYEIARNIVLTCTGASQIKDKLGQYVHITRARKGQMGIAEVQVFSGDKHNVALHKKARMTTVRGRNIPTFALDGDTKGQGDELAQTIQNDENPAWEVDLGRSIAISKIVAWPKQNHLDEAELLVLDKDRKVIWGAKIEKSKTREKEFDVGGSEGSLRQGEKIEKLGDIPGFNR